MLHQQQQLVHSKIGHRTRSGLMIYRVPRSFARHANSRLRRKILCSAQQPQSKPQQQYTAAANSSKPPQPGAASQEPVTSSSSSSNSFYRQWYEQSTLYYSNYPLDRAADARRDEAQVLAWFNAPHTRVTPVNASRILATKQDIPCTAPAASSSASDTGSSWYSNPGSNSAASIGGGRTLLQPVWISPAAELGVALNPNVPPLFLGLDPDTQTPHFAVQVAADEVDSIASSAGATWVSARTAGPDMSRTDAALMAVASGLAQWHLDTQYHGSSGSRTLPGDGGFSRQCSSSGRSLYPRIDPAIITLITAGQDWGLLGRKKGWPRGRYSTLAGFLEIGESLEQALCREVAEESQVIVDLQSVRYIASQPWPFPRSLMVGFNASAAVIATSSSNNSSGSPISGDNGSSLGQPGVQELSHEGRMAMMDTGLEPSEVDGVLQDLHLLQSPMPEEGEMEDVRWFHRDWVCHALQLGPAAPHGFMIPGHYSLAHRLIMGWLNLEPKASAPAAEVVAAVADTGAGINCNSNWLGDAVPQVIIDQGVFKYILLRLKDQQSGRSKLLVRGAAAAAYHNHILQHTKAQVQLIDGQGQLMLDVLGGGRIEHYSDQGVVRVYGYSAAFGPAVHEVTVGLLKKWFPFYKADSITCSYEGY